MDVIAEHNNKVKVFHDIVGCAMDVYNEYNHGLSEYPYQYGLKHLLKKLGYTVETECKLPLYLFGEKLEEFYRCDVVMLREEGNIIIECKAVKFIDEGHRDQLRNYMLLTHCPFGILINFCKARHQIFSEVYHYVESSHEVELYDTRYIGYMHDNIEKPWQTYLDAKKKKEPSHYVHHISINNKREI